jgi:DNA-binding CsgD family transcriptional regulator
MHHIQTLIDASMKIAGLSSKEAILEEFEHCTSSLGGEHLLVTGIPMPNKDINDLIIINHWPHIATGRTYTPNSFDPIIQKAVDWPSPFILREQFYNSSGLAAAVGLPRDHLEVLVIPAVTHFYYQGVVVMTFEKDELHRDKLAEKSMPFVLRSALASLVNVLFHKLFELDMLPLKREGELTKREKEVVSLAALGKTAVEISETLGISERTVIAHLQHASMKLNASNRTECVLHSIRFHQIGPGAGFGFYQIETEIYTD